MFANSEDNEPSVLHKMLYVEVYIKYRKGATVKLPVPKDYKDEALLDHMWREGLTYMTSIGKKIRIQVP